MTGFNRLFRPALTAVCALAMIFALTPSLKAQTHVVSVEELKQQVQAVDKTRQANVQKVEEFLAMPRAEKIFETMRMDANQVKSAVATLDDQELAQFAARAAKAKSDFAAGDLSDRDLLLIVAGLAALILIIVAVR